MKRPFKKFTIVAGGTPQPLVGTTVAGAATIVSSGLQSVQVADSSMFKQGEWAVFDTTASAKRERLLVFDIPDATHIRVSNMAFSHAISSVVANGILVHALYIQSTKVNAGSLFVGTEGLVKATYVNVFAEIVQVGAGVQPIDWTDEIAGYPDGISLADYWIDGTTGDGYLPSCNVL